MIRHQLLGGETLQGLAVRFYGDVTGWRRLVTYNNLRPPYLSTDPLDQYGPLQTTLTLAQDVAQGQQRLVVTGTIDQNVVRRNAMLLLKPQSVTTGAYSLEAYAVVSVTGDAVNLTASLRQTYTAGTVINVYRPRFEVTGRVLRPGDILEIPGVGGDPLQVTPLAIDQDNLYGRDIAVDAKGRLLLTDAGGLDLTIGTDNLYQQLRRRVQTEQGALLLHPTYGCRAEQFIGQAGTDDTIALIRAWVALALVRDERVQRVDGVTVRMDGDVVFIQATVIANDLPTTLGITL